ncbi:nuclear transport factor 2 family protein [Rheinheimera sp. UJ63]|uniref:nuclear transport factor 2 family protein n=1 Tax=Rheinheimera sp. UJ63 TaxID=2910157 RepID=UPI001F318990|nr:nuclear transport factor 2 family protein [Rheinheimera sp. UJ63]MCF4009516.1 nuclear transport factor 2 family protein [Rheinheimera sp. UJ63]
MRSCFRLPELLLLMLAPTFVLSATTLPEEDRLYVTISTLDTAVFEAFNQCSEPTQLEKHANFFAEDIEFYHDTGGVTFTRDEMLANTKQYACGHFSRHLVAGSLLVHPIKDFGAISQGSHRFCQFVSGQCEGAADFTMVWRFHDGKWQITRVLSYGHRAVSNAQ